LCGFDDSVKSFFKKLNLVIAFHHRTMYILSVLENKSILKKVSIMEISKTLTNSNDLEKFADLIKVSARIGRDVSGCGFADVNPNSGNVYLWLEDYSTTLYIGLGSENIYASWSCPYCGEEFEMMMIEDTTENDLEEWVNTLTRNDGEHCEICEETE